MSDEMKPQPFDTLLHWILNEYETNQSIFGIPRALFHTPQADAPYALDLYGHHLATPIGPAAGPHTQLAQNIVCAWLCGGRFIELKTVQIMDELEIPRPCIDMEDEGYNVEWSQELKLEQSVDEYVKAWALIHVLRRLLGWEAAPLGTVFNMSVGYNLEGVQHPRMTRFMDRLRDPAEDLAAIQQILRSQFPQFADLPLPNTPITDNVTLSTMHGCPPDEIERIAQYLMEERGLHTTVKLNPTLLGQETVLGILHNTLGFTEIDIPARVFDHDLQYGRAVALIRSLKQVAAAQGLVLSVKLSNTLAMANRKGALPGDEMYMSGRALYPVTMNLFRKLAREFDGDLNVSYSAGADALNVTNILAAGARPITAASDLLKPGGYARLANWLERLAADMQARGAASLDDLARDRLANLEHAAAEALTNPRYKRAYNPYGLPKVESRLDLFDCIAAPCVEQCAVCQDVPDYAWLIARGEYDRALQVILARNPLPGITGYVCTHLCQTRCTRSASNYDQPVAIRALKRFAVERGNSEDQRSGEPSPDSRIAVIGSGPAGLAAAYFLALNGVRVTIFEAQDRAGGMPAIAPAFRIPQATVQADVDRTLRVGLGVELKLNHPVTVPPEELLAQGYDAVYVACGFPQDARLTMPGIEGPGVFAALDLLAQVARGEQPVLGDRVLVIGGGNTAMDAARTARRLTGQPVTVVYRRTRAEMPAEAEELDDLFAEGNALEELAAPVRVIRQDGRVTALECVRNALGEPGPDGRRRPVPTPGSEFQIPADSIVVAIGQAADVAFLNGSGVVLGQNGAIIANPASQMTNTEHVYAGGDAVRGPAIIIQACADGRRAAEAICAQLGIPFQQPPAQSADLSAEDVLKVKRARARKEARREPATLPPDQRGGFDLVEQTLTEEAARAEAARCLQCATVCDKCVEVCPNRANYTVRVEPVCWSVPVLACPIDEPIVVATESFQVTQTRQIIHVDDFCNECGNCATFCVHPGEPYQTKPRLFLQEADFRREKDNAFYIAGNTIRQRVGGREARLTVHDSGFAYENAQVRVNLAPDFEVEQMVLKRAFAGLLSLRDAAEMALIWQGVTTSLPWVV
ncbi:MAG: putative selenate reductase subunit YgfK [Chloroflexi bacterium]|nr:putative selenate reductase subunit YgfK [Chloroflexota bacterium]